MKLNVKYTIPVTNEVQFEQIKRTYSRDNKIFFNCFDCHKPVVLLLRKIKQWPGKCRICKIEDTNIQKYGSKYQTQTDNFKKKRLITQNGIWLTEKARNKIKNTKKEKYGDEYYTNRPKFIETYNKHKNEDVHFVEKIQNKMKETCKERYNVEWFRQSKEYEIESKITNNKKYCSDYYFSSDIGKQHIKDVLIEKYGVEHALQCKVIRDKQRRKYTYNGLNFDSSWEIAFYIYLIDKHIRFEYHSTEFDYYWPGDDKIHKYEVDFKLYSNTYVEIKNVKLLNNMIINEKDKEHFKYLCMKEHNVNIITDCSKYLNYVKFKYGKNYLNKFKNNK